jgi:hypothetical protein
LTVADRPTDSIMSNRVGRFGLKEIEEMLFALEQARLDKEAGK